MSFQYKENADIIDRLKAAGYTSYKLRQEKLMGESTLQKFRNGTLPSWHELDILCKLLDCQPWDIIEFDAET